MVDDDDMDLALENFDIIRNNAVVVVDSQCPTPASQEQRTIFMQTFIDILPTKGIRKDMYILGTERAGLMPRTCNTGSKGTPDMMIDGHTHIETRPSLCVLRRSDILLEDESIGLIRGNRKMNDHMQVIHKSEGTRDMASLTIDGHTNSETKNETRLSHCLICRSDILLEDEDLGLLIPPWQVNTHMQKIHGSRASACVLCRGDLLQDDEGVHACSTNTNLNNHIASKHE
jgi:hypothetical protein